MTRVKVSRIDAIHKWARDQFWSDNYVDVALQIEAIHSTMGRNPEFREDPQASAKLYAFLCERAANSGAANHFLGIYIPMACDYEAELYAIMYDLALSYMEFEKRGWEEHLPTRTLKAA